MTIGGVVVAATLQDAGSQTPVSPFFKPIHTHSHIHTHTQPHSHIHTYIRTYTLTRSLSLTRTHTDPGAHATKSSQNLAPSSISQPPQASSSLLTIHDASPSSSKSPGRHAPTSPTGKEESRCRLLSFVNAPPSITTSTFSCSCSCSFSSAFSCCCCRCCSCSSSGPSSCSSEVDRYAAWL